MDEEEFVERVRRHQAAGTRRERDAPPAGNLSPRRLGWDQPWAPALHEAEVRAVEERYGFELPAAYRLVLTRCGNGGPAPAAELLALLGTGGREFDAELDGDPTLPFRYADAFDPNDLVPPGLEPHQIDALVFDPAYVAGTLRIAHTGCGFYTLLVVDGAGRGELWEDGRASDDGIRPYVARDTGARLTFAEWYLELVPWTLAPVRASGA